MSVIGEFTIPADEFALARSLAAAPEMTIEADRLASHSPKEVFPFLWATGGDFEQFQRALEVDPAIVDVSIAEEADDDVLYRLKWDDEFCSLIHDMVDHHAAILEAKAQSERWHLRLRFTEEAMVSDFQAHFQENDHRFELRRLSHPDAPRQGAFGLTADQREALTAAVNEGYFSVPRTTSVEELGERLGISANAVSQRIRRGCDALIRSALMITDDE